MAKKNKKKDSYESLKHLDEESLFCQMTVNANGIKCWESLRLIAAIKKKNISDVFMNLSSVSQHMVMDEVLEEMNGVTPPDPDDIA